jgi:glycosyltransferase involved in cell wall biosynthesis
LVQEFECHLLSFGPDGAAERFEQLQQQLPSVKGVGIVPLPCGVAAHVLRAGAMLRLLPPSMGPYLTERFRTSLVKTLETHSYDLVFYDVINLAPYVQYAEQLPSLHSPNDATSRSYLSLAAAEQDFLRRAYVHLSAWLLRRYEQLNYHRFSRIHVVSKIDADYLKGLDNRLQVETIPIAVGDDYCSYPLVETATKRRPHLVFSGSLSIPGIRNGIISFIDRGLPIVLKDFPDLDFMIVGKGASVELKARAENIPALRLVEWVPDYPAAIAGADVVVVPDQSGTGLKNRVLQAMALGRPVVGSSVALEGFEFHNGVQAIECHSPQEMGREVARLLAEPDRRRRIGIAARSLVADRYSLTVVGERWRALVRQVVENEPYRPTLSTPTHGGTQSDG